jgi:hypothetical protein
VAASSNSSYSTSMSTGPRATRAKRSSWAAVTSTSNDAPKRASRPDTRARAPAVSRSPSSASTSKGIGAQPAIAAGSVSIASTAAGSAATVVCAVQVLMTTIFGRRRRAVVSPLADLE